MNQLPFYNHHHPRVTPPQRSLPIVERLTSVYKLWHEWLPHVPKIPRYNIGNRIDQSFLETIEAIFSVLNSSTEEKLTRLRQTSTKLELVKFLLQIAWEIKALDDKKYVALLEQLQEVGRQLGGWLRKLEKETPANSRQEKWREFRTAANR